MKKTKEKQEWQVEWRDVNSITPYANNARKNDDTVPYLINSIKRFGFRVPLVIDKDGVIVCGHTRLKAALQIGMERVPCVRADDLTKAEIKAFRLADNKIAEMSEWDFGKLDVELEELKIDFDDDMTDFGFEWGDEETDKDGETEEDAVPEIDDNNTVSRRGCVYQLGEHRLMCGDSTDAECVTKLMNGEIADIEFTSPPYNAGSSEKLSGNTHTTESKYISNNDNLDNYDELLFKSTENGIAFSKYAIINIQMLAGNKSVFCDYLHRFKAQLCDIAIWNKTNAQPAMAERVMNSQFEFILFFSKENNSRAVGTNNFRGTVSNIFECSPQRKNEFSNIHAATFSIEFVSYYIKNFSVKENIILDLFGGTGTTLIACEQLNRKCRMMEIDERYCDVVRKRWAEYVYGEGCNWEELTPETN